MFVDSRGVGATHIYCSLAAAMAQFCDVTVATDGEPQNAGDLEILSASAAKVVTPGSPDCLAAMAAASVIHANGVGQLRSSAAWSHGAWSQKTVLVMNSYRHTSRAAPLIGGLYLGAAKRFAKGVIFLSDLSAAQLSAAQRLLRVKSATAALGASVAGVEEVHHLAHARTDRLPRPMLVYLANFTRGKRHRYLLRAIEPVLSELGGSLLLLGDGPLRERLKAEIARRPALADRVELPGRLPHQEALAVAALSDLCLVASRAETFGHCVLEPLLLGVPTVATSVGVAGNISSSLLRTVRTNAPADDLRREILAAVAAAPAEPERRVEAERLRREFSWSASALQFRRAYSEIITA